MNKSTRIRQKSETFSRLTKGVAGISTNLNSFKSRVQNVPSFEYKTQSLRSLLTEKNKSAEGKYSSLNNTMQPGVSGVSRPSSKSSM